MEPDSPDQHMGRLATLEQELDDLYGHLGLPKPAFGELTVRRVRRRPEFHAETEARIPDRAARRGH